MRDPRIRPTLHPRRTTLSSQEGNSLAHHSISYSRYEMIRAYIHSHPELSAQESDTGAFIVSQLHSLGIHEVHDHIGGSGVAAVLRNGEGMAILLRAEMDALPILEQTGLPYASKVTMKDLDGKVKPVMHACGHDVHVTCLLAAVERLVRTKSAWSGTVIFVFQPNEEHGGGAQSMVDDGLYEKVPIPDMLFGQHVMQNRAGRLGLRPGITSAGSDSFHITMYGRGGHASRPNTTIDPIVMAASTVMRLQAIVSRELDASKDFAVLSIGSLQAGEAENIIPETAELKINLRTVDEKVRSKVIASIKRILLAESNASGAPREPSIRHMSKFPITINDQALAKKLSETFSNVFGESFNPCIDRSNASEDFSILATSIGKPSCYWEFGGTDPDLWDRAAKNGTIEEDIPVNHSPFFAPVMQPTIQVGTEALIAVVMTFLSRSR